MMALSASWNVSGCNETGFAFGMTNLLEGRTLQLRTAPSVVLWRVLHVDPLYTRASLVGIHDLPHRARSDKSLIGHKEHSTSETTPIVRLHSCSERTGYKPPNVASQIRDGTTREWQHLPRWPGRQTEDRLLRPDRSLPEHQHQPLPLRCWRHPSTLFALTHLERDRNSNDSVANIPSVCRYFQSKMRLAFRRKVRRLPTLLLLEL